VFVLFLSSFVELQQFNLEVCYYIFKIRRW